MTEGTPATQSFRDLVISSLAELNTNQKNTLDRLSSMNDSIKELYLRTESNKAAILNHAAACPLQEAVKKITVNLASSEASHPNALEVDQRVSKLEKTINQHYTELKSLIVERAGEETGKEKLLKRWWPLVIIGIVSSLSALRGLVLAHCFLFQ